MCGLSCSKCMFWICYKVSLLLAHTTDSLIFERKNKTEWLVFIFLYCPLCIISPWLLCSIVYNNEFSARLSVGSIMRLRAAAITSMSQDSETDTAMILRLARHFLHVNKCQQDGTDVKDSSSDEKLNHQIYENQYEDDVAGIDFFSIMRLKKFLTKARMTYVII